MLDLQARGFGTAKGIPTMVVAAASFDDVRQHGQGAAFPGHSLLLRPPGTHGLRPGLLHAFCRRASAAQTPAAAHGAAIRACQSRRRHCLETVQVLAIAGFGVCLALVSGGGGGGAADLAWLVLKAPTELCTGMLSGI